MGQELRRVGIEEGLREAQLLLYQGLGIDMLTFLRREEECVPDSLQDNVWLNFNRRKKREPMAYVLGKREFFGRDFKIGKGALIPRPETEHLIEWVIETHQDSPYQVGLDLCAGPGTLGLSLALELGIFFSLVELSETALFWARINQKELKLEESTLLIQGDVTKPLNLEKVDLIVSNPPYVPSAELLNLEPDVRDFEPSLALDGGADGLQMMHKMMLQMQHWALPGCHLYLELGQGQHELLENHNFDQWHRDAWRLDLARIPRIVRYTFKPS